MPDLVLPGVYIDVHPEGLIIPGEVRTGNIGIVGTANKGPVGVPVLLGSYADAVRIFGHYDPWPNEPDENTQITEEGKRLTLVRALELAYNFGATTVYAVRVADKHPEDGTADAGKLLALPAQTALSSSGQNAIADYVSLTALTPGTWADSVAVNVSPLSPGDQSPFIEEETHVVDDATKPMKLSRNGVTQDARNSIQVNQRMLNIVYDADPQPGGVGVHTKGANAGELTFPQGEIKHNDTITAFYAVTDASHQAVKVTVSLGPVQEVYTAMDGIDLAQKIGTANNPNSAWVSAMVKLGLEKDFFPLNLSQPSTALTPIFKQLFGGDNGPALTPDTDLGVYKDGLNQLLDQDVQIIVAAGQDDRFGNILDAHCQAASTDVLQRERIAIVGSRPLTDATRLTGVTNHNLNSDRVIFVAPGIVTPDNAASPSADVTLPGSYAAAAVAGLLSGFEPHISLTNKVLSVDGLEISYSRTELIQLLNARVMPLEVHLGFHIVRGITTSTNTAWKQITTRRIVDYAKVGVRQAADPYIGLLNNERVRGALSNTINSFLTTMVNDEMLISYDLDVSATREQEIQGIVQVTMTLRPVFSIDFIQVTMFLG